MTHLLSYECFTLLLKDLISDFYYALEKMYMSFIRPLLEYSDSVSDNATAESKRKQQLEAVHNDAARIITGATKLCGINNLLADLGWET